MKLTSVVVSSTVVLASAFSVSAHVGRGFAVPEPDALLQARSGHAHGRRSRMMARANPSTNAEMAKIEDPSQECKPYGLSNSAELSKAYPKAGQIADIVVGDDDGGRLFEELLTSNVIPNIQPKQGVEDHMGISDQASNSYNMDEDPDCWWTATGCTTPKGNKIEEDITSCPEPRTWGLTFADGPNCSHNAFYDYMQQNNLKATLFYIGTNVIDWPLQAQRGLTDGHDICVHTWSHHYMTTLTNAQVFSELYYTMRIIKDVTGVTPRCWRPPFGDVDNRVRAIASFLGLRTIIWDNDTDDWNVKPGGSESTQQIDQNYQNIIQQGNNGTTDDHGVIVLTHELTNSTMGEFIRQYPAIKKAYDHVVPLTACFNATSPYAEDKPTYTTFSDFVSGNINAQGLPDGNTMTVNVKSKMDVQSQKNQTSAGGFSPTSIKQAANGGSSSSGSSSSSSAAASSSSSSSGSSGNSGSSGSSASSGSDDSTSNSQNKGTEGHNGALSKTSVSLASLAASAALSFLLYL